MALFRRLAYWLDDIRRAALCLGVGGAAFAAGWRQDWGLGVSILCAWNIGVTAYLAFLGVVVFTADAPATRERISRVDPTRWSLLIVLVLTALLGVSGVGAILTTVGRRTSYDTLLMGLSAAAVVLSWLLLHSAFGQHYARLYYQEADKRARPFPGGMRGGFAFPGTPNPAYEDFLYVSFAIGLTYAMSDVSVTNQIQRRTVLMHSIISFFFYSTILGAALNALSS